MKGRRFRYLALGILIVGLLALYWVYIEKADSLPKEEEILAQINAGLSDAEAVEIQDLLKLDTGHGVAPFLTAGGGYGVSYWERHLTGWKVIHVRTDGEPRIWMLDPGDPSSFHITWNMNPDRDIETLQYYYIRERGYSSSGTEEHYVPGIQMKVEASIKGKSYGAMKIPDDWGQALTLSDGSEPPGNSIWESFNPGIHSTFGWIPLDKEGNEVKWENRDSSSYSVGNVHDQHMQMLDQYHVEQGLY
ncbi:hypothetical protein [Rossellomorea sp. YZS02]|uniref:hypothetical protein n=1 Tax=Rossellomorea sp. YZS02 TaxID=3097358 RepID=UPI002A16E174|nr:hypothetical protein [Rossellomorea sp. YZS02]MDX8344652.1 hypothetical protein [Rossellomorea sp. YZS02]